MASTVIVFLVLTIVTPGNAPNMEASAPMPSLEECVRQGTAFVRQDPKDLDGDALAFSCLVSKKGDPA